MTLTHHVETAAPNVWLAVGPWFLLAFGVFAALAVAANWMLKPRPAGEGPLSLADINLDVTEPHLRTARHRRYDLADDAGDMRRWRGVHRPGRTPYVGAHRPARGYGRAVQVDREAETTVSWVSVEDLHAEWVRRGLVVAARELVAGGVR